MAAASERVTLTVAGREVQVSNPDKVFFPTRGETKQDLVDYYLAVGDALLAAMGGRPVMLERYPDGAAGKSFFQKRVPAGTPDWVQTTTVSTPNGTESNALVVADLAHVVWAVNLGCLGFHVWPYHAADPAHVDELRLDLDPCPGTTFEMVREAAFETRTLLDELGVVGLPKTTGSKGMHVYVRLRPEWDAYQVRAAAVAVARELARRRPDLITDAWWKEERGKRIFIDFNQNAPHKTVFGAWSVRPRVGGQVSTPLTLGRRGRGDAGRVHPRERARSSGRAGRPVGGRCGPQSLEPFLEMVAPGRSQRFARCAVAARLPQNAKRAQPGGTQPGSQGGLAQRQALTTLLFRILSDRRFFSA